MEKRLEKKRPHFLHQSKKTTATCYFFSFSTTSDRFISYATHSNDCTVWLCTCGLWRAGLAAAPPQQTPSAAAGKVLCGSWGGRCRSLAPQVTKTSDRQSWTTPQTLAGLWEGKANTCVIQTLLQLDTRLPLFHFYNFMLNLMWQDRTKCKSKIK